MCWQPSTRALIHFLSSPSSSVSSSPSSFLSVFLSFFPQVLGRTRCSSSWTGNCETNTPSRGGTGGERKEETGEERKIVKRGEEERRSLTVVCVCCAVTGHCAWCEVKCVLCALLTRPNTCFSLLLLSFFSSSSLPLLHFLLLFSFLFLLFFPFFPLLSPLLLPSSGTLTG